MTRFIVVFTSFKPFPLVPEKWCEICQADGRVCIDECSSLSDLIKKKPFTLLFNDKIQLSSHEKWSFKLPAIICGIQGTSQMGSKNNLSLSIDYRSYFFRIKVPWPGSRGAWLRHFTLIGHVLHLTEQGQGLFWKPLLSKEHGEHVFIIVQVSRWKRSHQLLITSEVLQVMAKQ